ncbi:ArpU family phage packaging/lysis transcriptional regulator [Virgibacillus ihumii]|uniref:ArpU family phage packaging/lysis transcriptional regulator n=1 Tax=Virgibacillus ihumii TaxID=2686091 RepID=UPI00157C7584|nr:ArpU family phage packaging/lysis transcriptional regulator [Virgibacillus ihumii]
MYVVSEMENLFTQKELDEVLKNVKQFYIHYAEENWLNRYKKIKRLSKETSLPKLVVPLSDMPYGSSDFKNSKVEKSAMKSIQAAEWLDILHQAIDSLNDMERELIQLKYINRRNDGGQYSDEVIFQQLFVGKTKYYQIKKHALEMLGRKLYAILTEGDYV